MLRPQYLSEILGQKDVKKRIQITIEACNQTGNIFPHSILVGSPGVGKTTISEAIANELNKPIEIVNGSNLRNVRSLLPYLARITEGSILFCDEVHKTSPLVQTYLLTVIEQFRYTVGHQQDSISLDLPNFTFLCATTNTGLLLEPLLNRFVYRYALEDYSIEDLTQIILQNSKKMGLDVTEDSAIMIAGTSRSTPRTSVNRLRWIYDYSISKNIKIVNVSDVKNALKLAGIGIDGTEEYDRQYLRKLQILKSASLNTLASALNLDPDTIEKDIEPFLIRKGLIKKTTRGRQLV